LSLSLPKDKCFSTPSDTCVTCGLLDPVTIDRFQGSHPADSAAESKELADRQRSKRATSLAGVTSVIASHQPCLLGRLLLPACWRSTCRRHREVVKHRRRHGSSDRRKTRPRVPLPRQPSPLPPTHILVEAIPWRGLGAPVPPPRLRS